MENKQKRIVLKDLPNNLLKPGVVLYKNDDIKITIEKVEKDRYGTTLVDTIIEGFFETNYQEKGDIVIASNYNFGKGALTNFYGAVGIEKSDNYNFERYTHSYSSSVGMNKVNEKKTPYFNLDKQTALMLAKKYNTDIFSDKFKRLPEVIKNAMLSMPFEIADIYLNDVIDFYGKDDIKNTFKVFPELKDLIKNKLEEKINNIFKESVEVMKKAVNAEKEIEKRLNNVVKDEISFAFDYYPITMGKSDYESLLKLIENLDEIGIFNKQDLKTKLETIYENSKTIKDISNKYEVILITALVPSKQKPKGKKLYPNYKEQELYLYLNKEEVDRAIQNGDKIKIKNFEKLPSYIKTAVMEELNYRGMLVKSVEKKEKLKIKR